MAKTMWGARFAKDTNSLMEMFNASIDFDKRLYLHDIKGSIAHAQMLAKCGIISEDEFLAIKKGLEDICCDIKKGGFVFKTALEDIHMNIEQELTNRIGAAGQKLHTARSRNDQVAVDMHLYLKDEILNIGNLLFGLLETLLETASKNRHFIFPAMTHLQHAQPVSFAHHMLAYFCMFSRDMRRLKNAYESCDVSPLGAGAVAGTAFNIDRKMTAELLGFKRIYNNSMDAVSDRDYILDFLYFASVFAMHLSRFCEEIILWSSQEFSFIELDDAFATGSSMMPQKKNPDAAELIRGKTGRFFGHLMAMLTTLKGLPLAYNKDMQEDKEGLFDAIDNLSLVVRVFGGMLETMSVKGEGLKRAFEHDYSNATDMADYLVKKGIPFRQAHHISGQAVALAIKENKTLQNLTLDELKGLSESFDADIFNDISIENCVNRRDSFGATSIRQIDMQIESAKKILTQIQESLTSDFLKEF
jgi:argininosuccinate lyase